MRQVGIDRETGAHAQLAISFHFTFGQLSNTNTIFSYLCVFLSGFGEKFKQHAIQTYDFLYGVLWWKISIDGGGDVK